MSNQSNENVHCPICQQKNNCCNGLDKSLGICWCTIEKFPQAIFDLVPEDQIRKACLCKECLEAFKRNEIS